jgi:hypothetical protein
MMPLICKTYPSGYLTEPITTKLDPHGHTWARKTYKRKINAHPNPCLGTCRPLFSVLSTNRPKSRAGVLLAGRVAGVALALCQI